MDDLTFSSIVSRVVFSPELMSSIRTCWAHIRQPISGQASVDHLDAGL